MAGASAAAISGPDVPTAVTATPRTAMSAWGGRWTAETRTGIGAADATLSAVTCVVRSRVSPYREVRSCRRYQRNRGGKAVTGVPTMREAAAGRADSAAVISARLRA